MNQENKKAIIRYSKNRAIVLCNRGHFLTSIEFDKNYAGSYSEMLLSFREDGDYFDRMAEKCQGYGH